MADSYYLNNDYPWWLTYHRSRLCLCSLYLYHFLKMYILGISAYYHDSAACIIKNGEIIAAAQEERFTRKKHDHSFEITETKTGRKTSVLHTFFKDVYSRYLSLLS